MAEWAAGRVGLHFIPPGEPWRNGYIESFNSRIRDECLNTHLVGRISDHAVRGGGAAVAFRRRRCGTRSPSSRQRRWIFL